MKRKFTKLALNPLYILSQKALLDVDVVNLEISRFIHCHQSSEEGSASHNAWAALVSSIELTRELGLLGYFKDLVMPLFDKVYPILQATYAEQVETGIYRYVSDISIDVLDLINIHHAQLECITRAVYEKAYTTTNKRLKESTHAK
jgi:hypothetical protein